MMTPQEVANCTFAKSVMGGYNMASVDDFLDKLTEDYSALYKENAALKAKLKVTVDKMAEYRESEDAIRSTLLAAQKMSSAMIGDAEKKRDELVEEGTRATRARLEELKEQIAGEERRLEAVRAQVDQQLEVERKRLEAGQAGLRQFILDVRAVCNEELAQLELLPALPAEEPKPEPAIQVIPSAPPAQEPQAKEEDLSHDDLVQALTAFAPVEDSETLPVPEEGLEQGDAGDDPFAEEELEDTEATRIINLDDLQFGPNYTKD